MTQYICYICEKPIANNGYHIDTYTYVRSKDGKPSVPDNLYRHLSKCESEQINKPVVLEVQRREL